MNDQRRIEGTAWVRARLGDDCRVTMLAGDASFRRYFRVHHRDRSYVLMDAPPGKEDVSPYLAVRQWLDRAGVRVPELLHEDRNRGFLLLEDLGDRTWAGHLGSTEHADSMLNPLMQDAFDQLHRLQAMRSEFSLPLFDVARMQRECDLYLDWYLPRVADYTPAESERAEFHTAMLPVLREIDALPKVPVHLDFHSRNLMLPNDTLPLGVIDFQDAVTGPVTYDPASLLYDCYQDYAEPVRRRWSETFYNRLDETIRSRFEHFESWHRSLRLTALQRHIKAIGIFGRLAYRDGKRQFLDEIPLTRKHLRQEMQALAMDDSSWPLLLLEPADRRN